MREFGVALLLITVLCSHTLLSDAVLQTWPVENSPCVDALNEKGQVPPQVAGRFTPDATTSTDDEPYFLWFFSARNPKSGTGKTPLIVYTAGSGRCSTETLAIVQIAPCRVLRESDNECGPKSANKADCDGAIVNPHAWNEHAHVLVIDAPWSSPKKKLVTGEDEDRLAKETQDLLVAFVTDSTSLSADTPVTIVGESVNAHFVPAIGRAVIEANAAASAPVVNLVGVAMGSGLVAPKTQLLHYPEYAFNNPISSLVDRFGYDVMRLGLAGCLAAYKSHTGWEEVNDDAVATNVCDTALIKPVSKLLRVNLYDIRQNCTASTSCMDFSAETKWLEANRARLGVNSERDWAPCEMEHKLFYGKWESDVLADTKVILEADVSVLVYNGVADYMANVRGAEGWVSQIEWAGANAFKSSKWHDDFALNGQRIGRAKVIRSPKEHGGLSLVQVEGSGHLTSRDAPEAMNALITEFATKGVIGA